MRWARITVMCTLGLALSCAGGEEVKPEDGLVLADGYLEGLVTDGESPDLKPGVMELVAGHVSTLGGPASATKEMFEGKPDYEVSDDGLEYAGLHGALCSADQDLCITEGGIVP